MDDSIARRRPHRGARRRGKTRRPPQRRARPDHDGDNPTPGGHELHEARATRGLREPEPDQLGPYESRYDVRRGYVVERTVL